MENIELKEQNVVLEVNGVAVDLDVIAKDAEIELNNNEMETGDVKLANSRENLSEANQQAAEIIEDIEKCVSSDGSMDTDNGQAENVDNSSAEGEPKVDDASDTIVVKTEPNIEPSESSESSASTESTDETKQSDNIDENSENLADSSEASTDGEHKTDDGTVTPAQSDASNDAPNETEQTPNAANATATEQTPNAVDATATEPTPAAGTTESTEAAKKPKSTQQKSPKKKAAQKKRKARSETRTPAVDYSKFMNYALSVSHRQRRYFLQIARGRHNVPVPGDDCEIFVSNIPINVLESELLPLFERFGKIFELRLMMSMRNPKRNAGFAFVRYTTNGAATEATEKLNDYEIVPGKHLAIRLSQPNLSLFVGNIHRGLTREQIHEKISNKTTGLVKTFVKSSLYEDTKNCGFCFLEHDSHSAAMKAKHLLNNGNVWGRQLFVDWAQRRKQIDEGELQESKTLFVNYLPKDTTDQQITDVLSSFGTIEKITKIKDYAFVIFTEHQAAINALNDVDKTKLGNDTVEISLAMPKTMKNRNHGPTFAYRRPRPNRRNNSYNRHMPPFGSSYKFHTRKSAKTDDDQNTRQNNAADAAASTDAGQTVIPSVFVTAPEPLPPYQLTNLVVSFIFLH